MADQQQTSIPQHMLRRLQTYFRDTRSVAGLVRCVVTESEECTWHHLNHDRNDHRLSNIVPLIQRLNTNLYNAREDFNRLDSRLDCASLRSKARTAFWEVGQVAQAYGCTRIEYYVAEYCKKPISYRLNCARQMLYYARHRLNYNILGQLLKRYKWGIHFIQVHPMGCGLAAPEQECEIARIVRVAAKPTHTRIHCGGSLRAATPRIGRATQPHAAPEQ